MIISQLRKAAIQGIRLAIIPFLLLFAACYETDQEVIRIDQAVAVPDLVGSYTEDLNELTIDITAVPYSNEYRYREVAENGKVETGTLRIIPLRDTIYLVQSTTDGHPGYILAFYDFRGSEKTYETMDADASEAELVALATQYGVSLTEGDDAYYRMSGSPDNMLAFLLAHKNFTFVSSWDF